MQTRTTPSLRRIKLGLLSVTFVTSLAEAAPFIDQQQQHIQTQQSARESQLTPSAPDISLENPIPTNVEGPFLSETPCFPIKKVHVTGTDSFPGWFRAQAIVDQGVGHCLGVKGINQLMGRLQNRLIAHGWVTSRVLVPAQDLSQGELTLSLVAGTLGEVRYAPGSDTRALIGNSVPATAGKVLDLRDIEQGLENQQRLPTVEDTMEIVPGQQAGESDVVITRHQAKVWRVNLWTDDSGTKSTGRTQVGGMLALDNPFALSDLLYVSASQDKMHSTYDSVQEQTGLFAGKGGFDVKVGEHTQLNGAVIGSTASAEHNRLETGTLGFSDIENQAAYKVEHQSVGASTGAGSAGNFIGNLGNALAIAGNKEKNDSSTTHAAVSDGTIVVRNVDGQQQNIKDLSRDVAHANQTLSPIFDKEKEQQRMQTLQLIGEVGNQAADIARKQGDIAGVKAQSDPAALEAARAELMVNGNSHPTAEQVAKQAYQTAQGAFGTGSAIQQAITASTAAIQGLAGGDIAKALAGGAAPYLAEEIHKRTTTDGEVNKTANLMAHAVVNAALSLAKGENALAGASSAVTAEAVGMISKEYYDKNPTALKEDEKQTVSALASLAAGLAGGLVGGDTASAVSGMQTGKVTVENNWLSVDEAERKKALEQKRDILKQPLTPTEEKDLAHINKVDKERDQAIRAVCTDGQKGGGACGALIGPAQNALNKYGEDFNFRLIYKDLYPQDAKNLENVLQGLDAGSINRDQAITAIAQASGVSWETAASRYDTAMQLQALTAALAGAAGFKGVTEKPAGSGTAKTSQPSTSNLYPSGISFKLDQPEHMGSVVKYSQQKGITGGHNADAFYSTVSEKNVKIVGEMQTGTKGVTEVQYQIPAYDRAGNVTGYKDKVFTKTIYDPKIITDQKILNLGQEAASKGYKAAIASGQREYTETAGGIRFQVYLDQKTGIVENFYPVAK